ncbi:methyl-accepting chemotaxis protein McpX [Roseivivax marinus]|uniref:Methyl-accepting chemotaxis protein McpX n=2 Tax=Roseivivax marinus TaxID=1379903 RepID=W4HMS8_9RHOB|nr:methyl-accepting chemotaxis protein McpX [Roseivivax marinus]
MPQTDIGSPTRLRRLVHAAVLMPIFAALALGGWLVWSKAAELREARQVERSMDLAVALGDVVHEQQRERGASSVYLESAGTQFAEELRDQRRRTDARARDLMAVRSRLDGMLPTAVADSLAAYVEAVTRRSELRARIDALDIPAPDAIGAYTQMNTTALTTIGHLGSASGDGRIAAHAVGFLALLGAKESAGIERAVGAGGFATGRFDDARLMRMGALIARQDSGFDIFRSIGAAPWIATLSEIEASPASRELTQMRAVALDWPRTRSLGGIAAGDFFAAATERIVALKALEETVGTSIAGAAAALVRSATVELTLAALVLIAGIGLSPIAVRRSVRLLEGDVRSVVGAAEEMTAGHLEGPVPYVRLRELVSMRMALESFRQSIREALRREGQLQSERAARIEAEASKAAEIARLEQAASEERARRASAEAAHVAEVAAEVNGIVTAYGEGDFARRIDLAGGDGQLAAICQGMNRIGDSVGAALGAIRKAQDHLAERDLSFRLPDSFNGVFGDIARAMNEANTAMAETVARIGLATSEIDTSIGEIGEAAQGLAERSERNAAVLEETTASLTQMAELISVSTVKSRDAEKLVAEISSRADVGNDTVQKAIAAMETIRSASERIDGVLKVIDDIAFQTNLLALNAGVEAARAGDAGRGFAVVAAEVRALALRSSDASREISEMIASSGVAVQQGVALVNNSGEVFADIVTGVRDTRARIVEIASAATESEATIRHISDATSELDQAIQRNAAMFEETNAAIGTLRTETEALVSQVSAFRLPEGPVRRQSPRAA